MPTAPPPEIPAMPPRCRRESLWALGISLLPVLGVLSAWGAGRPGLAVLIFGVTFVIIAVGSVMPRCALFGPLMTKLPQQAAEAREVCLTIDDGPDPATTPALLDLLDKHGARAVFFLIGERARQHPGLVAEIARRGHEIGNHSQTHPAGCFWLLRPWQLWREVAGCQETLRVLLGRAPVWFRPPVGHHNLFLAPILRALGLRMMIWNCRGFDGVEREVSSILRHIERGLRPGSIILLHEGRSVSPVVLGATLEMVARKGLLIALPKFL